MTQFELINNEENKQYEFRLDALVAKIEYIITKEKIFLTHTEVPHKLAGKGIGKSLVQQVLQDIKE